MQLLGRGVDVDSRDAQGRTAATAAVYADDLEIVQALIEAGADVDIQDDIARMRSWRRARPAT